MKAKLFLSFSVDKIFFGIISVFLITTSSLLSFFFSPDNAQYKAYFDQNIHGASISVEKTYYYISLLSNYLSSSSLWVFILYSAIAVIIKSILIKKYSPYPVLSLIVYCSFFFVAQESNMIRIGLASSFFIWACFLFFEKKIWGYIVMSFISVSFHTSCLVVFLIPFIVSRKVEEGYIRSLVYLSLCFLVLIISPGYDSINEMLKYISAFDPTDRLETYIYLYSHNYYSDINYLNKLLPYLIFVIPLLLVYFKASQKNRFFSYSFQILCFGFFVFSLLSPLPVFAYRFSEIFLIFSIFTFPFVSLFFKSNALGYVCVYFYFVVNFIYLIFIRDYFGFLAV